MIDVHLVIDDTNYAYYLLAELEKHGFEKNHDFEWKYIPSSWDYFNNTSVDKSITFSFKDNKIASWFLLKYGTKI